MQQEIIQAIMQRRSIRKYQQRPVSRDLVAQILSCGLNAPSARNLQPWHITVIQDAAVLEAINTGVVAALSQDPAMASRVTAPEFHALHHAPQALLISAAQGNKWAPGDCGMLTQNILLAAQALGLGTCVVGFVMTYLGAPQGQEMVQRLVPQGYEPLYAITLGYPDETPDARPREDHVSWC